MSKSRNLIEYRKGKFSTNNEVIITLGVSKLFINLPKTKWSYFLDDYLKKNCDYKYEITNRLVLSKIFKEKIFFKFKTEAEMIEHKRAVVEVVKKAIDFTNKKIKENLNIKIEKNKEEVHKKEKIKKINKHFDDVYTNSDQLVRNNKISDGDIVDVISATGQFRFLINMNDLREHLICNPSNKLEKTVQNRSLTGKISLALNVNSLDPFWFDKYGRVQLNSDYLSITKPVEQTANSNQFNGEDVQNQFTIQYDNQIKKYVILDPTGQQLAASFVTFDDAQQFAQLLEYKNGRTVKRGAK